MLCVARRGRAPGSPASRRARRPSSARSRGADRPARPGEQGEQRGVGGQVVQQGQRGHHLGHLGQPQQPLSPTISTGMSAAVSASKTSAAWALSRVSTPISRHAGSAIAACAARTCVGQPGQLVGVGLVHGGAHRAVRRRPAVGLSGARLRVLRVERRRPARWRARGCGGRSAGSRSAGTSATSGGRRARGKSSPKPRMFDTEAPRQP